MIELGSRWMYEGEEVKVLALPDEAGDVVVANDEWELDWAYEGELEPLPAEEVSGPVAGTLTMSETGWTIEPAFGVEPGKYYLVKADE